MKRGLTLSRSLLIIILFFFMSTGKIDGQGKTRITLGLGFPETINAGFRYQFGQSEVGANIGFYPAYDGGLIFKWEKVYSVCGDYYFHFAGTSANSDLRPYYIRVGLNYLYMKWDEADIDNLFSSQLRVGRDFYFDSRLGVSVDGGILVHLNDVNDTWGYTVGWAAGICLFYKF